MKKKIAAKAFVCMCIVFLIGLVLIFTAPSLGRNAASVALQENGGSMDTSQYERIIDHTTVSYQAGGFAIALVGGFGLLLGGYALYKDAE